MKNWFESVRKKLINNSKVSWKLWSLQLNALAVILSPVAVIGDAAPAIVAVLPSEIAAVIDPAVLRFAPFLLVLASMVLRLFKQDKLA